jgi:hypothetical protein
MGRDRGDKRQLRLHRGAWAVDYVSSQFNFFSSPPRPDRLWCHPTSYPMSTGGADPEGKAAGA